MQSKLTGRPDGFLHSGLTFTGYNKMEPKQPTDLVYPVCYCDICDLTAAQNKRQAKVNVKWVGALWCAEAQAGFCSVLLMSNRPKQWGMLRSKPEQSITQQTRVCVHSLHLQPATEYFSASWLINTETIININKHLYRIIKYIYITL